jgi:hypothetical protein
MNDIFISSPKTRIKTIKPGNKHFKIKTDFMLADRASIEIDSRCPTYIAEIILDAYNRGWVKPVANVTEKEFVLIGLSNDQ